MSENLIGQEIEAYCGKCKDDTLHSITTLSGDKIEKVMCNVCMSYHKYKEPAKLLDKKIETKPVKEKTTRPRRSKWTRLLNDTDSDSAIEYEMEKSYEVATAIQHKTFGLGVIKNVIDDQKIEVLFHDGEKILVQNFHC